MPAPAPPAPGLGQYIRDHRKAANLSQLQLAQLLGLHQTIVSDWERGRGLGSVPRHASSLVAHIKAEPEGIKRLWWDEMGGYLVPLAA